MVMTGRACYSYTGAINLYIYIYIYVYIYKCDLNLKEILTWSQFN